MKRFIFIVLLLFSFNVNATECVRTCIEDSMECLTACQEFDGRQYVACMDECHDDYEECEENCFGGGVNNAETK